MDGAVNTEESNGNMMSTTTSETAITMMQQRLPEYIQNIFMACGYDTLQTIAEMDVGQTTVDNDIDTLHKGNFS